METLEDIDLAQVSLTFMLLSQLFKFEVPVPELVVNVADPIPKEHDVSNTTQQGKFPGYG
jgi:hypothetical protein